MSEQSSGATPPPGAPTGSAPVGPAAGGPAPAGMWPKAKRPSWKVILAVVALILVGVPLIAYSAWRQFSDQLDNQLTGPIEGANHYLSAVEANDPGAAYARLCASRRAEISLSAYQDQWARRTPALGLSGHNALPSNRKVKGHRELRTVNVDLTTIEGSFHVLGTVQKENGEWHWCGLAGSDGVRAVPLL